MNINILGEEKGRRNKFQGSRVGAVGIFNTQIISTDLFYGFPRVTLTQLEDRR